jgi:hypothetical protein
VAHQLIRPDYSVSETHDVAHRLIRPDFSVSKIYDVAHQLIRPDYSVSETYGVAYQLDKISRFQKYEMWLANPSDEATQFKHLKLNIKNEILSSIAQYKIT